MNDLHELTEEFKAFAISESVYRDRLRAAGCPDWLANELVREEMQARFANDPAAQKEGVYA